MARRAAPAATAEQYSGRKPKGRYVALSLQVTPAAAPLKLDLSQVRVLAEEGGLPWETGVAGVVAGPLLVPAAGTVEVGEPADITLVFDLPAKAPGGAWRLVTDLFPPIKVTLP